MSAQANIGHNVFQLYMKKEWLLSHTNEHDDYIDGGFATTKDGQCRRHVIQSAAQDDDWELDQCKHFKIDLKQSNGLFPFIHKSFFLSFVAANVSAHG